jgi:hypothetical protein
MQKRVRRNLRPVEELAFYRLSRQAKKETGVSWQGKPVFLNEVKQPNKK